jgi:predicted nucleotidyltransferase
MSTLETALRQLVGALDDHEIPYMVVGGLANAIWGEARATVDVDVTVWVEEPATAEVVDYLTSAFRTLTAEPVDFVRKTRVLPLESADGVRMDVIFGVLPFEKAAIERAVAIAVEGRSVRVCTAEDLLLMKIVSNRERDQADAKAVILRRGAELDLGYLEPRIRELAALLARDDVVQHWEEWKAAAGR